MAERLKALAWKARDPLSKGSAGSNPASSSMKTATSAIGRAGEHLVVLELLSAGFEVFWSASEGTQTDLVVATEVGFKRVQVKTVIDSSDGKIGLKVYKQSFHRGKSVSYNYLSAGIVDVFAIAVLDRKSVVYVSAAELRKQGIQNGAIFRFEISKNKQPSTRLAHEYTWNRALRDEFPLPQEV